MSETTSRLEQLVRDQFADELELSKESGLYDNRKSSTDAPPPVDAEAASRLLITRLTTGQIVEILKRAKQPQLEMEAITAFERYVAALDGNKKMPSQMDTYVNPNRKAAWARQDANAGIGNSVAGWNLGVIDSAEELEDDRNLSRTFETKRAQNDSEWDLSGLRLPNPRRYALAQLRAILQRVKPLDQVNWSVLNDDTGNSSVLSGGHWLGFRVYFDVLYPGGQNAHVRFRPEVVAKAA